jgi:hypothetical protein
MAKLAAGAHAVIWLRYRQIMVIALLKETGDIATAKDTDRGGRGWYLTYGFEGSFAAGPVRFETADPILRHVPLYSLPIPHLHYFCDCRTSVPLNRETAMQALGGGEKRRI